MRISAGGFGSDPTLGQSRSLEGGFGTLAEAVQNPLRYMAGVRCPSRSAIIDLMESSSIVSNLASYVPDLVLRRLQADPNAMAAPALESNLGAVMIADVSGFTLLTEKLAEQGAAGIEELTRVLNEYFGHVIDLIDVRGGDIVRFAGDAILAVWHARDQSGVGQATRDAASCALLLQSELLGYRTESGVPSG